MQQTSRASTDKSLPFTPEIIPGIICSIFQIQPIYWQNMVVNAKKSSTVSRKLRVLLKTEYARVELDIAEAISVATTKSSDERDTIPCPTNTDGADIDDKQPCSWCYSTGFVGTNICQECRGTGFLKLPLKVKTSKRRFRK